MIEINCIPLSKNSFRKAKFDQLTLSENGLLLKHQNKAEQEIPFAQINKLYIKKYNLHPAMELFGISIPFLFIIATIQYIDLYLATAGSMILALLIIKTVMNFKWYRFYIVLKDGTVFSKRVHMNKKSENISVLEKVYAQYLQSNFSTVTAA
jgi:hypothetical protein